MLQHLPAPDEMELRHHRSRLPLGLYILSFAPPFSERKSWKATLTHPYVLYTLGFLAAVPAGVGMVSNNLLFGYWTTLVTAGNATKGQIEGTGNQMGWILTLLGAVSKA
jgi:hypothetical protein